MVTIEVEAYFCYKSGSFFHGSGIFVVCFVVCSVDGSAVSMLVMFDEPQTYSSYIIILIM